MQQGLAATLNVPVDAVRVIWTPGPGSYGRNDADDAAMDAAVLAKAVALQRQWLHAKSLSFAHPADGRIVRFDSDYPADLAHGLQILGQG